MTASHRLHPGSGHAVIRAGHADAGRLVEVITAAFFPLPPSRWLVPRQDERRDVFPRYFRILADHALACGVVHTTPGRTAAALWMPAPFGVTGLPAGYTRKLEDAAGGHLGRFLLLDHVLDRHHPTARAHHHLAILAVHPDSQGHGTGTALLRAHHAELDHFQMPAYLEASDLRTRNFYLRSGYADHGEIQLPEDGPVMHAMWRAPRPVLPAG